MITWNDPNTATYTNGYAICGVPETTEIKRSHMMVRILKITITESDFLLNCTHRL